MHLCLQVSIGLQGGDRYKASFLPGTEGPAEERACQSLEPEGEDQIVWFFFPPCGVFWGQKRHKCRQSYKVGEF